MIKFYVLAFKNKKDSTIIKKMIIITYMETL